VLSVDGGDFATLIRGENISPLGPTDGGGSGPVRFFLLGVADWPRGAGRNHAVLGDEVRGSVCPGTGLSRILSRLFEGANQLAFQFRRE
jgi:hypothetical protein